MSKKPNLDRALDILINYESPAQQKSDPHQRVMHLKSGDFYTVLGKTKHRDDTGNWRESVLYTDVEGNLYSRFEDDFDRAFILAVEASK